MAAPPTLRWPARLLLLAVGGALALVIAELGLRAAGVGYPRVAQRDEHRGTAYRPGITFHQSSEGGAEVSINSEGFRDVDHPVQAPANTIRIAVLGDSYVDATQVAVQDRFTERIAAELRSSGRLGGRSVQVMNFGMSGYGTAQELLVLRHYVLKYRPDLVVLAFLPFNDVRNNYRPLERDDGRPYFELRDGALVLDESYRSIRDRNEMLVGRIQYTALDYLRLAQLAYEARRLWQLRAEASARQRVAASTGLGGERGLDSAVYKEPDDEQWRQAWVVTESLLRQVHREATAQGAGFLLVTLSAGVQVDPDKDVRARFQQALGVDDLFYAERRVAGLCQAEGMPCLGLGEPIQKRADETGHYYHGFPNAQMGRGHWNEAGNALAAQLIAKALVDQQLISGRSVDHR